MKKVRSKVMTLCLSLGILAGTVAAPTAAFAATNNATYKVSNGITTDSADSIKGTKGTNTSTDNIYGVSKAWAPGVNFNVNVDVLGIANKISGAINARNFNGQNAAFCKGLMESAFYAANGQYNVVVMDLSQNYKHNISGVKYFSTCQYGGTTWGVWVFSRQQPKGSYFENDGRRGWDHWACQGWQTQDGNVMWYNR
ncbi:hypothetical protein [Clostridium saccharobutylicum]|uniref:Stress response protein YvgO n=1 Tax=Clostridium saccharobutylicum DSM 13864 TaxID=1345695 RepID=U5MXF4_CLOSA|nr:hypothetical protein [Clostridium saccharobutylicum]AGX44306.1 stress response protein YvgO [Clostridium saccharobutylicum DSM 13864]AQR91596.1 stress response protein YvgO precursor [Clostridium saccharobutylicum]AQS01501.1 stress response protein YvgO precursor [Clostridium saccharobutylicum]AQS11108.1 stress response protein YvgO precursor [Clostridium saccharobutylicum]AQS15484.1 stress response protein YvgO precursor [Clostridium saccharobutylicum]